MPKIKLHTKSPHIDMTPMVDLFSVVLTFLMLTTTMRQPEPAPIDTPFSVSDKTAPDANIMTLLLSEDNRVFYNIDNGSDTSFHFKGKILTEMGTRYNITFTPEEVKQFEAYPSSFGMPIQNMKSFLNTKDAKEREALQVKGIPIDSTDNQLALWVLVTRLVNPKVQACIKGDNDAPYPLVKKVLDIMQDKKVNRFNLITNLEATKVMLTEE
ncbi:MAG: biopolymer transporter ExbD [Bacteroidales bacterium]|nr:MAG: biopolymer transporter ExbD [Bacteroidales bacterium]